MPVTRNSWLKFVAVKSKPLESLERQIAELDHALADGYRVSVRRRLQAVRMVLEGDTPLHAAAVTKVDLSALIKWLESFKCSGVSTIIGNSLRVKLKPKKSRGKGLRRKRPKPPRLSALQRRRGRLSLDARTFVDLAAREKSPVMKARLITLARVASGMSYAKAGAPVHRSRETVRAWIAAFKAGGVGGLRPRKKGPAKRLRRKSRKRLGRSRAPA